jgi:hypothetical protein
VKAASWFHNFWVADIHPGTRVLREITCDSQDLTPRAVLSDGDTTIS